MVINRCSKCTYIKLVSLDDLGGRVVYVVMSLVILVPLKALSDTYIHMVISTNRLNSGPAHGLHCMNVYLLAKLKMLKVTL